jgi:putative MATE family efflux protein
MAKVKTITEGPIYRTIFSLAWPVAVTMLLESFMTATDYFWVGYLGTLEQDAVMTSMVVSWTIFSLISIIITGLTALVSRSVGGQDLSSASFAAKQGIQLAIGIGFVCTVGGFALAPRILVFMGAAPEVVGLGTIYLRIFFLSNIFFFLNDALAAIFRASGDTKSPTIAFASATVLNILLDPVLILGLGPVPKLGVAGAALATGISMAVGLLIFIWLLVKGKLEFSIGGWLRTRVSLLMMKKIFRIGLPISIHNLTFVFIYWFIIQIVHEFGPEAGAAMGVGNRMESLSFMTAFGFSMAASTLVGQNLGALKPDRAATCAWATVKIIVFITFIVSVVFIAIPGKIASLFSSDPRVLPIAVDYLIILGLSQVFMGIEIVLEGSFTGAGDTIPPMSVSVVGSISRLPLAYILCFTLGVGVNGVWWSLTITSFVKAIVLALWFMRGNWKKKKL